MQSFPPFYAKFRAFLFSWQDYEALAARMRTMQGRLLLSINDHPDIRELFAGFRTIELELAYSISREKTGKASRELAICNW